MARGWHGRRGRRGSQLAATVPSSPRVRPSPGDHWIVGKSWKGWPWAIVGEMALLHQGQRMATLRAVTPCRVAIVPKDHIDRQALEEIATGRMPRPER
jgi:hypothetical protein